MTRKFIPAEVSFQEWRKDPDYVAAYDALEDEFALAGAKKKQSSEEEAMGSIHEALCEREGGSRDRRVVRARELSDAEIALIAKAEVPAEHAHLDEELMPLELDAVTARGEDRTDRARASAKSAEELAVETSSDPAWNVVTSALQPIERLDSWSLSRRSKRRSSTAAGFLK